MACRIEQRVIKTPIVDHWFVVIDCFYKKAFRRTARLPVTLHSTECCLSSRARSVVRWFPTVRPTGATPKAQQQFFSISERYERESGIHTLHGTLWCRLCQARLRGCNNTILIAADRSSGRLPWASWWAFSRPLEQVCSLRLLVRESNP